MTKLTWEFVDPDEIVRQRAAGWPDFHPEDYCHRCGTVNPCWSSPEWSELVGGHGGNERHSGVLCPNCYMLIYPDIPWKVTWQDWPSDEQVERLASTLRSVTNLDDDAERVARCVIDAGWSRSSHGIPDRAVET